MINMSPSKMVKKNNAKYHKEKFVIKQKRYTHTRV